MDAILSLVPQLAAIIEKGGIVGLLLLITAVAVAEVFRLRKDNKAAYVTLDRYRLGFAILKNECDRANLKPDLSIMADVLKEAA